MVAGKFKALQWQENPSSGTPHGDTIRCINKGVGSTLQGNCNRGQMVSRGKKTPYKCSGDVSSEICNSDIHKVNVRFDNSYANRQQSCTVLSFKNGGHPQSATFEYQQINLGLSAVATDHDYCRVPPKQTQCGSGLGVKKFQGLFGMEVAPLHISENNKRIGFSKSGSVCVQAVPSTTEVHGMEAGSKQHCNRCNAAIMGKHICICLSPIQHDRPVIKQGLTGACRATFSSSANMANSTLAHPVVTNVNPTPIVTSSNSKFTAEPTRGKTPSCKKQRFKVSGVESFRESLQMEGISNNAAMLISQSRRAGSISNYESAWSKWAGWCDKGQIDPFCAPLNQVLNYLSELFDQGLQYRTINSHRSAISAYHTKLEGKPIGQHPHVCALLMGVFNQRPPQPRYTFVWDVETVLRYLKSHMPENDKLSDKELTYKLTILLALTAANRACSTS